MDTSIRQLRIFFRDEDVPEIVIPLPELGGPDFLSLGSDTPVRLPNGERIAVYAEVAPKRPRPDVSISVVEDGRVFGVRGHQGWTGSPASSRHGSLGRIRGRAPPTQKWSFIARTAPNTATGSATSTPGWARWTEAKSSGACTRKKGL